MSIKIASLRDISGRYSTFFFDLDGVIWKGPERIDTGMAALHYLRLLNKRLFFVTNNSSRCRRYLEQRFKYFGILANIDYIYPSGLLTARYLRIKYPYIGKVICVGTHSLAEQLRDNGLDVLEVGHVEENRPIKEMKMDLKTDRYALVLGFDNTMSYTKATLLAMYLQKGVKFIGTNADKFTMVDGFRVPGNGSMIQYLENVTGAKAEIVGKPNPFVLDQIISEHNLIRDKCLMIGDSLYTDITLGNRASIDTLCVLTGVSTETMVLASNLPTYYCYTLS